MADSCIQNRASDYRDRPTVYQRTGDYAEFTDLIDRLRPYVTEALELGRPATEAQVVRFALAALTVTVLWGEGADRDDNVGLEAE